jgi:hypothetical protein
LSPINAKDPSGEMLTPVGKLNLATDAEPSPTPATDDPASLVTEAVVMPMRRIK